MDRQAVQTVAGVDAPVSLAAGQPWPLGASSDALGVNFALAAPGAEAVALCLFDVGGSVETARWWMPVHTGGVWHGRLNGQAAGLIYGYRVYGPWLPRQGLRFNPAKLLLDPYARQIVGHYDGNDLFLDHVPGAIEQADPRENAAIALKGRVTADLPPLDESDHVRVPRENTVLYEMHLRGATRQHPGLPPDLGGTYGGLAEAAVLEHIQRLGVTSVNFLPLMQAVSEPRLLALGLSNYWGYNTLGCFCPDQRFWSGRTASSAPGECRDMVRALHQRGLEVILDVVFNHSAEGDVDGPTFSMRGIDNRLYYCASSGDAGRYENWSGCGNVLNLTEPRVLQLVMDALRFWVQQIGIDGFRFDLAPVLARGPAGAYDPRGAFFFALSQDPVLSRAKLIAEPWDIGSGGYQLGQFPAGWIEWNDRFRDTARRFWLGGNATRGELAQDLAGSSDVFAARGREPTASVNFITAHDGFTLRDSTSFLQRHNQANGEDNRDGQGNNHRTNCGVEGATTDPQVLWLRARVQRALLATLALSVGTPMLLAGDEIGHSQRGNNNAYCQDNATTWLDWAAADQGLSDYVADCLRLRREQPVLRRRRWLEATDVAWLAPAGHRLLADDWWSADRALGVVFLNASGMPELALLFNPDEWARAFTLPATSADSWRVSVCSAPDEPARAPSNAAHAWTVPGFAVLALVPSGA